MAIDGSIKNGQLKYDILREAEKITALLSSKIDKYEYVTCEELLPLYPSKLIGNAKLTYSPLGKALKKLLRTKNKEKKKNTSFTMFRLS